ncbi:MAG: glycogen/starch/alpha-glucan phosphorylase, partial [Clostridia bacterium]|nr:glycogen/starch/alpha-glucan phosphorylase [Clostridia bacterium]
GSVRMANLCLSCCHKLNGVSELHTDILKNDLFADYHRLHPDRTIAVTNGVTPRRWILQSNPALSSLLNELLGDDGWVTDLDRIGELEKYADDASVLSRLDFIKRENKLRLSAELERVSGITIDPDSVVDVQVKRLHEYKRQLMNILRILAIYFELVEGGKEPSRPLTFVFGAKASPGYDRAKQIIHLINSAADLINNDPRTRNLIRIVFVENYCATSAGYIIPAADISEQISLAGKEASGTGNMKFMMNGALTLGTLDGANVEMHRLLGPENIYIFGLRAEEVTQTMVRRPTAAEVCVSDPWLDRAVKALGNGTLGNFTGLMNYLMFEDPYLCLTDFVSYRTATKRILDDYENRSLWQKKSLINIARSGFFSSDRSIAEYRANIWNA